MGQSNKTQQAFTSLEREETWSRITLRWGPTWGWTEEEKRSWAERWEEETLTWSREDDSAVCPWRQHIPLSSLMELIQQKQTAVIYSVLSNIILAERSFRRFEIKCFWVITCKSCSATVTNLNAWSNEILISAYASMKWDYCLLAGFCWCSLFLLLTGPESKAMWQRFNCLASCAGYGFCSFVQI